MTREKRLLLEQIAFAYLVGEMEMEPIQARKKVESMTDTELDEFLD